MPARPDMSWETNQRLWRKTHKGKSYTISCKQLSKWAGKYITETKEGSYQTANDWWEAKRAEIDGRNSATISPYQYELEMRRDWARGHGRERDARLLSSEISRLESGLDPTISDVNTNSVGIEDTDTYAALEKVFDTEEICEALDYENLVWRDRLTREETPHIPDERTIGGLAKRYLEIETSRANANEIGPSEYMLIRYCINAFCNWAGSENLIETVNANKWESWWEHLLKSNYSIDYKKKHLCHPRNFIQWLGGKGVIPIPPNLHSRKHRFKGRIKAVPTMSISEVRRLVEAASGQLRLHLLLMLNCGMQQTDISELKHSEVDWDRARITRKRSKTEDGPNVPTVSYQLWSVTWKLLQEYRSADDKRVLLTKSNGAWVVDILVGEMRKKVDNIQSNYRHLQIKLKFNKPLKLLRKTSATIIESHENFGRYKSHFLGHSPRTVADRHYSAPSVELFDRIVTWLGQQYGFLPLPVDHIES